VPIGLNQNLFALALAASTGALPAAVSRAAPPGGCGVPAVMASAPPQPRSVEELHRTHLKRTADFFSGDVGGRAELDEARRVRARRRTAR
jgi:hypothetical protein